MPGSTYIFAGGATGGHLYPAIAVADELKKYQPDAHLIFICSNHDIDRYILSSRSYAYIPQPIRPLPQKIAEVPGFIRCLLSSLRLCKQIVRDIKPVAVIGTGGYVSVPMILSAARGGIRSGLINIDAVVGRANKFLAKKVEVTFVQFDSTANLLNGATEVIKVGCPIRQELLKGDANEARRLWGLSDQRKTLLIMAGSLGAININRAVAAIADDLDKLADDWQILHICGHGKLDELAGKVSRIRYVVMEYCHQISHAYAVSDLVLARAGASTIGELSAIGLPAVLMPYPYHSDRQQYLNAEEMVRRGAAIVVDDTSDVQSNAEALRGSLLEIMRNPSRLEAMSQAAKGGVTGDAAEKIARWMLGWNKDELVAGG